MQGWPGWIRKANMPEITFARISQQSGCKSDAGKKKTRIGRYIFKYNQLKKSSLKGYRNGLHRMQKWIPLGAEAP
jgi:hypothetical protein